MSKTFDKFTVKFLKDVINQYNHIVNVVNYRSFKKDELVNVMKELFYIEGDSIYPKNLTFNSSWTEPSKPKKAPKPKKEPSEKKKAPKPKKEPSEKKKAPKPKKEPSEKKKPAPKTEKKQEERKMDLGDYLNVLGLKTFTTLDNIKKAYKRLAKIYHPDKPTGNQKKFIEIDNAYKYLLNVYS